MATAGMEHYNKEYGFTFELLTPKLDEDKQARAKQHIESLCKLQIGIRKQIPLQVLNSFFSESVLYCAPYYDNEEMRRS